MLLGPMIITIINLPNLQVVPDSGNLFHYEGPIKESEF